MSWNLNEVTHIEYRGRHVYRIRFDDGLEGDVDFSEFLGLGPIFSPPADLSLGCQPHQPIIPRGRAAVDCP